MYILCMYTLCIVCMYTLLGKNIKLDRCYNIVGASLQRIIESMRNLQYTCQRLCLFVIIHDNDMFIRQ